MSRAPNLPDHQDPRRPDGRREPLPGAMDDVVFRRAGPRSRKPASSWRWRWWLAAGIAALLLVGVLRQPLADRLWPQTRAQALRAQAAQALAQGRLTAPDGSGARERFDAALAIDPDRDEAHAGLARVAVAALAQAREATRDNRFADAHAALRLARELSVPRADAARVEAGLREREAAHAGIAQLLATAAAARDGGHLDGDAGAALPIYQRVLALQPDNKPALEGREDALGDLLQDARAQLRAGGVAQAAAAVAAARGYDPGHVDLPETEALLNEESDAIRRHAEADLRRGRLEAAAQGYRSLADAGARSQAEPGRAHVAAAYAQRAQRLAGDFRFADAGKALAQGRALAPKLAELDAAERHVARAQQAHVRLGSTLPPRERARRVARLLDEAAAAEARGELVTPPGDSAFDKLGAARAIAPDDAGVRAASVRLLEAAKRCFEHQLRANSLAAARACLDARVAIEGDDAALAEARQRLARRWLAVGEERLGAGELSAARAALAAARTLDPQAADIAAFEQRLHAATPAPD